MRTRSTDRPLAIAIPSRQPVAGFRIRMALARRVDSEFAQRYAEAKLAAEVSERLRAL